MQRGHTTWQLSEEGAVAPVSAGVLTDEDLVFRITRGETELFATIVERYQRLMLSSALQVLGDAEAANDCAQEAFIEAFRSLANLREPSNLRAWLFGILRNRCRKMLSRRRVRCVPLDDETEIYTPSGEDHGDDLRMDGIRVAMNELPSSYREVLAARYFADMDYDEIASSFGTTVNNVRVRCCRARERLRQVLESRGIGREALESESPTPL